MNIRGIYKTSLIDYPGKISTVLFIGGCNLRCRYCHNPDIVLNCTQLESYTVSDVLSLLKKRRGIIDGVTITGGEPTIASGLISLLTDIKDLDLSIKLDSNGLRPDVLKKLTERKLIDYAAIDIKTSPEKFNELTHCNADYRKISETVDILNTSVEEYEIRTTCLPYYVTEDDLIKIKKITGHVKKYFIQQFVSKVPLLDKKLELIQPYTVKVLERFRDIVKTFSDESGIRGI